MKNRTHRVVRVTGGRVALMNTSPIPDAEIVKAIRMVAKELDPKIADGVVVHVKNNTGRARSYGNAYNHLPEMMNSNGLERRQWRYLVVVRASRDGKHRWIVTLAHEFKHIEQFKLGHTEGPTRRRCEERARAFGWGFYDKWKEATAVA